MERDLIAESSDSSSSLRRAQDVRFISEVLATQERKSWLRMRLSISDDDKKLLEAEKAREILGVKDAYESMLGGKKARVVEGDHRDTEASLVSYRISTHVIGFLA